MLSRSQAGDGMALGVRLLGPMQVVAGEGPISGIPRKGLALLAYLCRRSDTSVPRETLSGLLWGDSGEEQARASLRQTLMALRKAIGPLADGALRADATALTADPAGLRVDAAAFEAASGAEGIAGLEAAAALYRGEFLEGFAPVTPEFDRWAAAERSALRSLNAAALLRLADAYAAAGRTEDMIATAQRLLVLDPLQEHVHRRLIQAFLAQKRHDAALRQFDDLKRLLADELGVAPEPPTVELIREVRRARSAPGERPAAAPAASAAPASDALIAPGKPSIAVLPFRSLSEAADAAFLGEGIAEDVIIELSRDADLMVVARQSSFRFGDEADSPVEIGARLGVRFLLGGSVRVAGERVRVTAHLVRSETGEQIWAERFDRDLADIFAIQTEIARTVTATVIGRIADAEIRGALDRPPESVESWMLVLRGLRHLHARTREDTDTAIGLFERAAAVSPNYGRAFGLLAISRIYERWYFDSDDDVREMIPLAEKAVALDPRDGRGHCALGVGKLLLRDFDQARFHFETGLAANPNDDLLLLEYGRYLMYVDQPEEGLRRIREGMRLNPYHPNWNWNLVGRCLHMLERHQEALEAFQRVHNPPYYVHAYMAACHAALGNHAAAAEAKAAIYRARPEFDLDAFIAIYPYRNPATLERFYQSLVAAGLDTNS